MEGMILMRYGGSGRGFRMLERHIGEMSSDGVILLCVVAAVALVAAATASRWYGYMIRRGVRKRYPQTVWVALPKVGAAGVLFAFLAVFPVFALFSDNGDTWWVFMLFGWLGAAAVAYYVISVRHMNVAVMKDGSHYYLSRVCGLGRWTAADDLSRLMAHTEKHLGDYAHVLTYRDSSGQTKVYGHLMMTAFPEADRPHIQQFVRCVE